MDKNWKPTHRHLKRGSEYQHVATATLQCSMPLSDMQSMEVYCDKDGKWWVRPTSEFFDGRFVEVDVSKT